MGFCLVIVTCCKYFGTNTPNSLETLPTVGRNKSYSDSWEEKKKKKEDNISMTHYHKLWLLLHLKCCFYQTQASQELREEKN